MTKTLWVWFYIVGALGLLMWLFDPPTARIRYRLTIEVTSHGHIVSGSSVYQVRYTAPPRLTLAAGIGASVTGEAVALEVSPGDFIFALLTKRPNESYAAELPSMLWGDRYDPKNGGGELGWVRAMTGSKRLTIDQLPMLVRFPSIDDPTSVTAVTPNEADQSLEPGVTFNRATVEITEDPVTKRLPDLLPWLPALVKRRATLDGKPHLGNPGTAPLAERLHWYDFTAENL